MLFLHFLVRLKFSILEFSCQGFSLVKRITSLTIKLISLPSSNVFVAIRESHSTLTLLEIKAVLSFI